MNILENFIICILSKSLKFIHIELDSNKVKIIKQFIRFGIVGLSNTVLSYTIYSFSLLLLKRYNLLVNVDYLFAQFISFFLGVCWSFYWNKRVVFKSQKNHLKLDIIKSFLKTLISYSFTGLFLSSFLLAIWVNCFHISEFIAPIINLIVSVPLNFILNKYWAFKA